MVDRILGVGGFAVWVIVSILVVRRGVQLVRAAFRSWRDDETRPPGLCARCQYRVMDVPGPICPECGADTRVFGLRRHNNRVSRREGIGLALGVILMSAPLPIGALTLLVVVSWTACLG